MQTLAKAVVEALAFLELADNTKVDPEAAVTAMDKIASILRSASPEERKALATAVLAESNARNAEEAPEEVLDFYENFFEDFGLAAEEEE